MIKRTLKYILKILKWITYSVVILLILLYLLMRLSSVQSYLAKRIAAALSEKAGVEIKIGAVDISNFVKIEFKKLSIRDKHDSLLINTDRIAIKIIPSYLFDNILYIKNAEIDTAMFSVIEYSGENELNFMQIVNVFLTDTLPDTTSQALNIVVKKLKIRNSTFIFDMQDMEHFQGMDYVHLFVDSINIDIHDFSIQNDSIKGDIKNLSAREKCGFRLDSLAGKTLVSPRELDIPNLLLKANNTKAYAKFRLEYSQWADWLDFINTVRFNTTLNSSVINLDDLKYFSPEITGMQDVFLVSGLIKGSIENLKVSDANIKYGKNSFFQGDFGMTGLPDFEQTFMRFKVNDAVITNKDMVSFYLPGEEHLPSNDMFERLGKVIIKGRFTGFYYDFVSQASFKTALGQFSTDISLQPITNNQQISYSGKLNAKQFNLGKLLETDYIGSLNMQATIDGVGLSKDAKATYKVNFQSIELTNYNYLKMSIEGEILNRRITSKINLSNDQSKFYADGFYDFKDSINHLFLFAQIDNAEVNRFFLIPEDTLGRLTTAINLDLFGNEINNFHGSFVADSFYYKYNNYKWKADTISLTLDIDEDTAHNLRFISPFLNAKVSGFYSFDDFPNAYKLLIDNILVKAQVRNADVPIYVDNKEFKSNTRDLKLDIDIINIDKINSAFFPYLVVGKNSKISGNYESAIDKLRLDINTSILKYAGFGVQDLKLSLDKQNGIVNYAFNSSSVITPSEINFDSLNISGDVDSVGLNLDMNWGVIDNTINSGALSSSFVWNDTNDFSVNINSANFYVNDSIWTINPNAKIDYRYHYINVADFEIYHGTNNLLISGLLSDNTHDILKFDFNQFDISLIDFYTKNWDTDIDGVVNGKMELSSVWNQPGFLSDFSISNFRFNKTYFNVLNVNALYSRSRQAIVLDVSSDSDDKKFKYIDIGGFYYPYRTSSQLDLEARIDKFPLSSIKNYLSSFSSSIDGFASGTLKLKGNLDEPIILGSLKTDINDILIDYTNVHYKIHDNLIFTPNYFGLINANAEDMFGNMLSVTTKISHTYFQDIHLDIDVKSREAKLLNTTSKDNELFYGSAFGSGYFKLNGDLNKLIMKMDMTPVKKSIINIPISSQYEAEKIDFLRFVLSDSSDLYNEAKNPEGGDLNIDLDMSVVVTPSTTMRLVMNATAGDIITATGDGKLNMLYNADGLNIYGKYIIKGGNYLFTMQNIINKRFVIVPGSELNWDGDLESASINLKAIYSLDAKLWDLLQQLDSSEAAIYKRPSKVNCIINITGKLFDPQISFDIELPDESVATRELVRQVISLEATGNSEEINKNFVSLLVLGRFQAPSGYEPGNNPNALSHNTYEMLAEQVGNILNNLVEQVEIGVDWSPGDDITTQEVAVALTYKMLNDRLIIDGKFGTGGGLREADASARIVGDVNIEYKLTKDGRIRARVFNRTNYSDPLSRKAPYTQGVGISFRKDFNNFKELFTSKKKKNEQQKKDTVPFNDVEVKKNGE